MCGVGGVAVPLNIHGCLAWLHWFFACSMPLASLCFACLQPQQHFKHLGHIYHRNFQHWMPWLGWWWRVQQNVISMLSSRISWINRNLIVHCAFGTFLKACLLQRLLLYSHRNQFCTSKSWCCVRCCVLELTIHISDMCSAWFPSCHPQVAEIMLNLMLLRLEGTAPLNARLRFLFETWI